MGRFVRHRNSKRLSYRRAGRFAKKPTVEQLIGAPIRVCPHCNGFNVFEKVWSDGPFPAPTVVVPDKCGQCGKSVGPDEWK